MTFELFKRGKRAGVLLIVLAVGSLLSAEEADKEKIVREVSQRWIQVGQEQYERGFFEAASRSLSCALEYEEYLTAVEAEKLRGLLGKARQAAAARQEILGAIRSADELVRQGQLIKAKAHFEKIRENEFLSSDERKLVGEGLREIDERLGERKREMAGVYKQSVQLYSEGKLEKAREGFVAVASSGLYAGSVGKTAEDYLMRISNILGLGGSRSSLSGVKRVACLSETGGADEYESFDNGGEAAEDARLKADRCEALSDGPLMMDIAEPVLHKHGDIGGGAEKTNLRRSYARAVVKEAVAKAEKYAAEGRFYKAVEAVRSAEQSIRQNGHYVGEELCGQYREQLKQLTEQINDGRRLWFGELEERGAVQR